MFLLLLVLGPLAGPATGEPSTVDPAWLERFAPVAPPALEEADRARLETGALVVRELAPTDDEGVAILVIGLVEATPEQVWGVMSDCEEQDEFLPRVTHAAVADREGDEHTCELTVDLPFPLDEVTSATRHHVRRLTDGGYQRYWRLLSGGSGLRRDSGSWTVHPHAGGRRSLLVTRLDLLPKDSVPDWILRAAQTLQAPANFAAIRARIGERTRHPAPAKRN